MPTVPLFFERNTAALDLLFWQGTAKFLEEVFYAVLFEYWDITLWCMLVMKYTNIFEMNKGIL